MVLLDQGEEDFIVGTKSGLKFAVDGFEVLLVSQNR
jgi:hypothetical protein